MSLVSNPKARDAYQLSAERGISIAEAQAVFASEGWRPDGYNEVGQACYLPPKMLICNAYSLNMLSSDDVLIRQEKITLETVRFLATYHGFTSAIGHVGTAAMVAHIVGLPGEAKAWDEIAESRPSVKLGSDFEIIVAQYSGPRLPAGATELPEGAIIEFWHIKSGLPKDVIEALEEACHISSHRAYAYDVLEKYSK